MAEARQSGTSAKTLFRGIFGGEEGTLAATFRMFESDSGLPHRQDAFLRARVTQFDLPATEGAGWWRFFSVGDGFFAVVTDCEYATARREHAPGEGLVEFHFILDGPVELTTDRNADWSSAGVSMMVCYQKPGMAYDVICAPGRFRIVSLYVRPEILTATFGLNAAEGAAHRLFDLKDDTLSIVDQTIDTDIVRLLRTLLEIPGLDRCNLALSVAKLTELLCNSTTLLERRLQESETPILLSRRELEMFEEARKILTTDFAGKTIPSLARMLGTNSTKLKSGFKFLYGTTIFNYRNSCRMDRAMTLLADERIPVASVAAAVGFRHQASFTSAFRSYYGFAPKSARRMTTKGSPGENSSRGGATGDSPR